MTIDDIHKQVRLALIGVHDLDEEEMAFIKEMSGLDRVQLKYHLAAVDKALFITTFKKDFPDER